MVDGCCVCLDSQEWNENPLVTCEGCKIKVHQACYGIIFVPSGPWYCRKCESQDRSGGSKCELCPNEGGALKRTDNGGWAHLVCALYIPEVRFGNVATMEPIIIALVPPGRFDMVCDLCLENPYKLSMASRGACLKCNSSGCNKTFHVTCAQTAGLLYEEGVNGNVDMVKYFCQCDEHLESSFEIDI